MSFYTEFPVYPTAVLSTTDYPDQADDVDDVLADLVNALRDEVIAVQTELGTVPKAGYADVKTRLAYYTNWQNYTQAAGRVSGGAVTDAGDGKINIAAGAGYFKTTDSEIGTTVYLEWDAVADFELDDNKTNYIHMNYDGGTPVPQKTDDRATIGLNLEFTLARVYRSGTTLHIVNSGVNLPNFFRKEHERLISTRAFERASGGEISETGTRNIASTIGKFWLGLNSITTAAEDTSGADRFTSWYRAAVSGWTEVADQAQIDNGYYDDGSGTLHALTANRYAVFWVYIHYDSDLHVIYGQNDYKLTEAENAVLPDSLPDQVLNFGTLAAKIIIQKDAAAFTSIASAYKTLFPVSSPPDHNDLGGLQGGQADQYYHLNSAQHGTLPNNITAAANITDHSIVRGAGGAKGVQDSGIIIDDDDNLGIGTAAFGTSATKALAIKTGTPPESSPADMTQLYTEDVAGATVELDYIEYPTDEAAQAAYISSDANSYRSNADVDDEDMADITDWADGDVGDGESTQVTFDGQSCMKLDSGSAGNRAARDRDIGSFGARTVFSIKLYCDAIGTQGAADHFRFQIYSGAFSLNINFASDGLFIFDGDAWHEVGADLVVQDTWQEWSFDTNWTAQTVNVYLDGVLVASDVDCSQASATAEGTTRLWQYGTTTANRISYVDWLKAGSDFASLVLQSYSENTIKEQGDYSLKGVAVITDSLNDTLTHAVDPTIDLTGRTQIKIDIRASRTGSNIKIGFHDAGGVTTEHTANIASANVWQTETVDISGVSDANKDAIDSIIITIVNADAANTFYVDNIYSPGIVGAELKVRDELGNVTTLSPHGFILFKPKKEYGFPWSYYSENKYIGKRINVDLYGAIKEIETLSKLIRGIGKEKKFIYEEDIELKDSISLAAGETLPDWIKDRREEAL